MSGSTNTSQERHEYQPLITAMPVGREWHEQKTTSLTDTLIARQREYCCNLPSVRPVHQSTLVYRPCSAHDAVMYPVKDLGCKRLGVTCGSIHRMLAPTGEKGRRIRELTSVVQKRFKFPVDSVELYAEKVNDRGLCSIAQAESLKYKLLGGLAVRR